MVHDQWVRLARVDDCPPGTGRFVAVGELELAVFHLSDPDRFVVTRNGCPHAGGNLSAGTIEGAVVTCPWHHWPFDLDSGTCSLAAQVRLRRYECRVQGDYVYAKLPPPL